MMVAVVAVMVVVAVVVMTMKLEVGGKMEWITASIRTRH